MNISDALDSYLTAKVRIAEWKQEFDAKYYAPVAEALNNVAMDFARTSPMFDRNKIEKNLSPEALRKFRGE